MFKNETRNPGIVFSTLAMSLISILIIVVGNLGQSTDYIGPDNDDVMRLVQVRDLLAGQSWFDLHQYRLGLEGGTLMHWSRFIDAPIALLILFFSLFMSPENAEFFGVSVWPLTLIFPMIWAAGRGGMNLGGKPAMLIAQALAALYIITIHRFHPGALDHHNVQMALIATIVAMMLDPDRKSSSFWIAGFAAALALAIGAETTPLLAVMALIIAFSWGVHGMNYRQAAIAFGSSFAIFVAIAFFSTTPVSRLTAVTCDNLSIAFASLSMAGGFSLALAAALFSTRTRVTRFAALAASGALVVVILLKVAPVCMRNPLDSLDPLLQTMWLASVSEAQNIFSEFAINPYTIGTFYAVGFFSILVCLYRVYRKEKLSDYLALLVMSVVATLIASYQIRASIFANVISIFPLSVLIAEMQARSRLDPQNLKKGLAFAFVAFASVPSVWGVAGVLLNEGVQKLTPSADGSNVAESKLCRAATDMQQLASLPAGLVAGPSNIGAHVLRYTQSRALSAPYHRNPDGMLIELKIELASLPDAEKMMRDNKVRYFVLCKTDTETAGTIDKAPEGFVANLVNGKVPDYLEKLPVPGDSNMEVYVLRPAS